MDFKDKDQYILYLENIIALIPGNVYWKNRRGYYMGCNHGIMTLSDFKSPKDIIGKTIYDLATTEVADHINKIDNEVMETGQEFAIEEIGLDKNNNPAYYLTRKVPLRDQYNNIIGLLGISLDITERKRLEKELIEAKEKAEASSRAKTEFLTNMSHDIRTPLNGIVGFSQILHAKEKDPIKQEHINVILQSSLTLTKLISEIIELANLEFKGSVTRQEVFSLDKICNEIFNLMHAETAQKNISLHINISSKIPQLLIGDRLKTHRILLNIIGNAIKFTTHGQVTVNIELLRKTVDKLSIQFSIQDTGIGIAKDKLNVIFEKFTRLTLSDQSPYKGSGLGLYIAKKFIDDLNGEIQIESTIGKGSCFIVTLDFLANNN